MKVIKRDDSEQDFCLDKIMKAITKANSSVDELDRMDESAIAKVVATVQKNLEGFNSISVEDIQDMVEKSLVRHNKYVVSKAYILYRDQKKKDKKYTETESKVLSLINGTSELRGDNANKRIDDNGAISDYIAGITTKSINDKILPKEIIKAHKAGLIHWHDSDYSPLRPMHNCFDGNTEFITSTGIKKFNQFKDGNTVFVKDLNGEFRLATIHYYGLQECNDITLVRRNGQGEKHIYATPNHRWLLNTNEVTTDLQINDLLYLTKNSVMPNVIDNSDDAFIWCLGFLIGDGVDHGNYLHGRICGDKNQYIKNFEIAGYSVTKKEGQDSSVLYKNISKQDFLNIKGWRYYSIKQKQLLFNGYAAADMRLNDNSFCTTDPRVALMIEELADIAGYYIIKKKEEYRSTNYKDNVYFYEFFTRVCDNSNYGYKVKNIKPYKKCGVWCVEEPVTHTLTLAGGIVTGNCDVINVEDMLENGFQMGNTKIEPNKETPFRTVCNLLSQISLIVSGRQYGGQTITWAHTLPYIDATRKMIRKEIIEDFVEDGITLSDEQLDKKVEKKLRKEIYEGVKIYQYQILCHSSSNGQTPFVSNNLCLREAQTQQELDDFAMLIEAIFNRRIKGVKDGSGHYVTPLFPKLLYWMCEGLNVKEGDPYFYLTKLAAHCEVKRTQPDINSEKECRRIKEGQIIPSMGCRSLLGPIWEERTYSINTKFYYIDLYQNNQSGKKFGEYPYGTFVEAQTFENIPNGEYEYGYEHGQFAINFRGNTGWLMKKTDNEVVVYQPMVYGRFNLGVITINIPHIALEAKKESEETGESIMNIFYRLFDDRMELVRRGLKVRSEWVRKIKGMNSELLWCHGALARIKPTETVGDLMDRYPKRASISVGFVGLYETCEALIGQSNTTEDGRKLSKDILTFMNDKCNVWKVEDHLNYSIYGTPEESLTYKFALANRKDFGFIPKITDKDYVVNSYHVDPREKIDAFKKLEIEGEYLALSSGGAVSYVETLDLLKNEEAIIDIMQWMYDHILYAEFNRKIGVCYKCGHEGDIDLIKTADGQFKFRCQNCGNEDDNTLDVTARLCGYLGKVNAGNSNLGRLDDVFHRTLNIDNDEIHYIPHHND